MGNKILIYENGQRYEIDSDQIYVPKFDTVKKEDKDDKILSMDSKE